MARQMIEAGQRLPEREYRPGTVQLFLYNAAIWNAHRIHYDPVSYTHLTLPTILLV